MFKTILKITLWILVALLIALGVAYWTAPSWVPGQVQKFLPPSIELKALQLKRPGLTSAHIDRLELTLGEDTTYQVEFTDVELGYSLWRRQLTAISAKTATVQWPQGSSTDKTEPLQTIPLPSLPVEQVSLEQLTIQNLTLQPIIAQDININDNGASLSVTSNIHFLDKDFKVQANASRIDENLNGIEATIDQNDNQLTLKATPKHSQHWSFNASGNLQIQDFYPQPGIEPVDLALNGSVNFSGDALLLNLEDNNQLSTQINSQELGLEQAVTELLAQYHINSNYDQLEPNYTLTLTSNKLTSISFAENTLKLEQGRLNIQVANPSLSTEIKLSQLQLDLKQALTASMQKVTADITASASGLAGTFESPKHKASTLSANLELEASAVLTDSQLVFSTEQSKLQLGKVDYQGNNSTASITPSQWLFRGESQLSFKEGIASTHQWQLETTKVLNSKLNLSEEQFSADDLTTQFNFTLNAKLPQGRLSGNYQVANIALKQQPLKLSLITGNLDFTLDKRPKGKLSFKTARYDGKQIGVSNIAGQLNWSKQPNAFVADGNLQHEKSRIPFNYSFNLKSSCHNLKISQSSLPVSTITSWLTILKDYPQLSFNSGQFEVNSLDGDPIGLLFDGKLKLDNFNLNYDELYVRNWTIEDTLTSSSKLGGTLKSHIDSIELATDIAVTDVTFLMPHTINSLVITNLKGKLLKGTIEIPQLAVNDQGIPPFTAYLKAIDINALLSALNSEKLKLEGLFNFTIPLTITSKSQQIVDGQFKALGEGVIRLKSDSGKEANIAFQALENFHYKELYGTLNYNQEGNYVIELHLLGSNPELYNGFPIKLDLTLRGQLPELLYSMIISGNMTKPILDDLEQKQMLNIQP